VDTGARHRSRFSITRGSATWSHIAARANGYATLRASGGRGRLKHKAQVEEITVTEVPIADRPPLLEVYSERYGKFPTVADVVRALPDPADHPTFRIE